MQLAESFAATYTPQFFSDMFFEKAEIPKIEFVLVEQDEIQDRMLDLDDNSGFVTKAKSFVEDTATNLMHLPKDNLKKWKGVEMEGAQPEEYWKTCIGRYRTEKPNKDPEKCPKWYINYTLSCEDVFDEVLFDYVANCSYCVQFYNWTEPMCTTPCENATSYTNEFGDLVYDVRCTDPYYQHKLDK